MMREAQRPARATVVHGATGPELVLDMPVTRGLDAVSYPGGATVDLVVTAADGGVHQGLPERFEPRLDGGRVRVSLPAGTAGELTLTGVLEARNPDGTPLQQWALPQMVAVPPP